MMKHEWEISKKDIPLVRTNRGVYKDYILRFVASGKEAVECEFDTQKEAQCMVGFCNSNTGKNLGVKATQRKNKVYIWKES